MALTVEEVEAILRLKDELSGKLGTAQNNLASFASAATRIGAGLTAALTLPIAAVGTASITMAMNAVESENLFEVAFGGMAAAARAWSEELSAKLGLNEYELRKTSGTLFTMFESMGLAKEGAFEMATGLTELSADMASFFNLKPEEAFEKLRSGIVGQTEPLRALGILVDENTTKAYAYKAGIAEQGAELTQQEKVLARYGAIMEQTSKAQGDLARTIDSPTNQLRIMREQMNEAAISLGMALLPAFSRLIGIVKSVIPYIQSAVEWFKQLSPTMQTVIIAVAALAAAIGPLLVVLGSLLPIMTALPALTAAAGVAFAALTGPIGIIVGATAAFVVGLKALSEWLDTTAKQKKASEDAWAGMTREQKFAWAQQQAVNQAMLNGTTYAVEYEKAMKTVEGSHKDIHLPMEKTVKVTTEAAKATGQMSEEVKKLLDQYSGRAAQKEVDNIATAFQALTRSGLTPTTSAAQALAAQLGKLKDEGAKLPPVLDDFWFRMTAVDRQLKVVHGTAGMLPKSLDAMTSAVLSGRDAVSAFEISMATMVANAKLGIGDTAIPAIHDLGEEVIKLGDYTATLKPPDAEKWSAMGLAVKGHLETLGTAVTGTFAQIILGAEGFKSGFVEIWESIKSSVVRIFSEIMWDFTNRFIKGMLNALSSNQATFASAFRGFLGFGSGAAGAGAGGGGIFGASGSEAGMAFMSAFAQALGWGAVAYGVYKFVDFLVHGFGESPERQTGISHEEYERRYGTPEENYYGTQEEMARDFNEAEMAALGLDVPQYAHGGTVQETGLGFLHRGETVTPATAAAEAVTEHGGIVNELREIRALLLRQERVFSFAVRDAVLLAR